jgi:phosphate transport system permease protein
MGTAQHNPTSPLHGSRVTGAAERVMEWLLRGCTLLSLLVTAGIVTVLLVETFAFFREVPIGRLIFDTQWTPLFGRDLADKHFGIWPLVSGTLLTTLIAMLVAVPFGLLAAIHLAEYARPDARRVLKPLVELLAGVPTVVYGFFALVFVTPALQWLFPALQIGAFNALSPGLVMGIMIIPTVASLSDDALRAVPSTIREAAFGVGMGRATTIFRVMVPTAASGISASVILGFARALGETMIVVLAAGLQPRLTADPRVPIQTMTAYVVQIAKGDVPAGSLEHRTLFVVGFALFLMTMTTTMLSYRISRRMQRGTR